MLEEAVFLVPVTLVTVVRFAVRRCVNVFERLAGVALYRSTVSLLVPSMLIAAMPSPGPRSETHGHPTRKR